MDPNEDNEEKGEVELEEDLKNVIQTFLNGIQIQEEYLQKSQGQLHQILDKCVTKSENFNDSSLVTHEKCQMIQSKLAKIPKIQTRIEALSKVFLEAHKKIQNINKIINHLTKQGVIKPLLNDSQSSPSIFGHSKKEEKVEEALEPRKEDDLAEQKDK